MNTMKKLISGFLVIVLVLTSVPLGAFAADKTEVSESGTTLQYESSNALGDVIAQAAEEDEEENADEEEIFSVNEISFSGNKAYVRLSVPYACTLIISVYDDDTGKMTDTAYAQVDENAAEYTVEMKNALPEYYLVKGYIVGADREPLSEEYTDSLHTRDMQELLSKSSADFDEKLLVNASSPTSSNFAVAAEDSVVVNCSENVNVVSANAQKADTYDFANASEDVKNLKTGDTLYAKKDNGDYTLIKVKSVVKNGNNVSVTADRSAEIGDLFSFIKINSNETGAAAPVKAPARAAAASGSAGNGSGRGGSAYGDDERKNETKKITFPVSFKIENGKTHKDEDSVIEGIKSEGFTNKLNSKIELKGTTEIDWSTEFYYNVELFGKDEYYFHQKSDVTFSGKLNVEIEEAITLPVQLFRIKVPTGVPGLSVKIGSTFEFKLSGKITGEIGFEYTQENGVKYENGKKIKEKSEPKTEFQTEVKVEVTIGISLKLEVGVTVLEIVNVGLSVKGEISAKFSIFDINSENETISLFGKEYYPGEYKAKIHDCDVCLLCVVTAKLSVGFEIAVDFKRILSELFVENTPPSSVNESTKITDKDCEKGGIDFGFSAGIEETVGFDLGTFRLSLIDGNFEFDKAGKGKKYVCPHIKYLTAFKFTVAGTKDKVPEGLKVVVTPVKTAEDSKYRETAVLTSEACDSHGICYLHLPTGKYTYEIQGDYALADGNENEFEIFTGGKDIEAQVKNRVDVTVNVHSTGGKPLQNVTVTCGKKSAVTDANGKAVLNVTEGSHEFTAVTKGSNLAGAEEVSSTVRVDVTPENKTVDISLYTGTAVTVKTVNKYGDPMSGVLVNCGSVYAENTNSDGETTLFLSEGEKTVTAMIVGYTVNQTVTVGRTDMDATLVFDIGYPVCFSCMDAGNSSVVGAKIYDDNTGTLLGKTEPSGNFTTYLDNGSYTAKVSYDGATASQAFTVNGAQTSVALKLSEYTSGDISWEFKDGTLYINGSGRMNDYSHSHDLPWYSEYRSIKKVVISSGITHIGNYSFADLDYVESVSLPSSLTSIGSYAFSCKGLTSVTIPESVTTIGARAFSYCSGLTSVTIPESVTTIGDYAFYYCRGLTEIKYNTNAVADFNGYSCVFSNAGNSGVEITVNFGDNVERIPAYLFSQSYIKTVNIGKNVTTIGNSAFYNCSGLTSVTIPESVTTIGDSAFSYCRGLTSVTIPESVTTIGDDAFYECSGLTSVTIPESVTTIGAHAFSECSGLTSVTIPESVTTIGGAAFSHCRGLTSVTIPESVTTIGGAAFYECSGLTEINYNTNAVADFNGYSYVFSDAGKSGVGITVNFGDNVERIPAYLFSQSYIKTVNIGKNVTTIGGAAFSYCSGLTEINYNAKAVADFDGSCRNVFFNSGTSGAGITVNFGDNVEAIPAMLFSQSYIKTVNIGKNVTTIGNSAFYNCRGLTSVTIGDSVTTIGDYAFHCCRGLTSVTIPESVTTIGYHAFYSCSGLTKINWNAINCSDLELTYEFSGPFEEGGTDSDNLEVIFGENVEHIPSGLFYRCYGLTEVTIPESVKSIGSSAFFACLILKKITWNAVHCSDYPKTSYDYDHNIFYPFRGCGGDSDKLEIVFGENIEHIPANMFYYCNGLTEVTMPEGLTSIGTLAFYDCSRLKKINWNAVNCKFESGLFSEAGMDVDETEIIIGEKVQHLSSICAGLKNLKKITIPNNVTSIEARAFAGCTGLKSITIPDSVTSIGAGAFDYCSGLESITIPDSVTSIEESTFEYCTSLKSVTIPDSVTSIGAGAFEECRGLESITIPDGVTSIEESTFEDCTSLKSVTIPDSVTNIGAAAFEYCKGLESITIPDGVTSIGKEAFLSCWGLTEIKWNAVNCIIQGYIFSKSGKDNMQIVFGEKVKHIPENILYGNDKISKVTIPDSITSIGEYAFSLCDKLTEITIPDSITNIGKGAFSSNSNLTLKLADEMTIVPNYLLNDRFGEFGNIAQIVIGDNVKKIGRSAFKKLKFKKLTLGSGVEEIGTSAFYDCFALETVVFNGTPDQWSKIKIGGNNDKLLNANIIFSSDQDPVQSAAPMNKEQTVTVMNVSAPKNYAAGGVASAESAQTTAQEGTESILQNADTVTVSNAVPGRSYILYLVKDENAEDFFSGENLTYVWQQKAESDTVLFEVPACEAEIHAVVKSAVVKEPYNCKANGHIEVFVPGTPATCTENGVTASSYCKACRETLTPAETIPGGHSFGEWITETEATATQKGLKSRSCSVCGRKETQKIPYIPAITFNKTISIHIYCGETSFATFVPETTGEYTIRSTGLSDTYGYLYDENHILLDECDDTDTGLDFSITRSLEAGKTYYIGVEFNSRTSDGDINVIITGGTGACAHTNTRTVSAVAATCTADGYTAGVYCEQCKTYISGHTPVSAVGHNYKTTVTAPTCTAKGYTTHKCANCGNSYKDSYTNAKGHDVVKHSAKAPTCSGIGWDAYDSCSRCSYTTYKEKAALGHNIVKDAAVPATCTEAGLSAGEHCTRCDYRKAQTTVAKLGHTAVTDKAVAATCTKSGKTKGSHCSVCGEVITAQKTVAKLGHTAVTDKAVAATCTKSGKTKGSHCSVCGKVITAQKTVAKLGHSYKSTVTVKATTSKSGKLQDKCSRCGYTKSSSTAIPMIKSSTLSYTTATYNGKTKSPTVTVKDSKGNKLVKGTDYTVSYSNNKNIGKATAKITFKGKYSGTKSLSYKIIPGKVTGLKATQTTTSVKLSWTAVSGAKTYRVYKYSSTTKKYTQITSTTGTSCTVKNLKAGTAYTYYVRASKTVSGTTYYSSAYTPIKTGTKPSTPKTPTLTAGTKKITVKWSKVTGASGYEVQMKKGSSGKYNKIYGGTGTSYTKTSLTKGSTYYFKVRAYKTVDGKNIYSAYSKEKYTKAK